MKRIVVIGLVLGALVWVGVMSLNSFPPPPEDVPQKESFPAMAPSSLSEPQSGQSVSAEVVKVVSRPLERTIQLSGELRPYLSVDVIPKVTGIVEKIHVDRGSVVQQGDVLVRLSAPELRAQRTEAEAQFRGADITYSRLRGASSTPGVVAGNELELALHHKDAAKSRLQSLREMEKYLEISAPFDGVIVQRHVHPGAMVGPGGGSSGNMSLMKIEQVHRLRLVVPVPEMYSGSIANGIKAQFTVPAYPEDVFTGVIARVSRSVDQTTRTMPVEMDVANPDGRLASGMFTEVRWPVKRSMPTLFVPLSAVATTTEHTFVVRVTNQEAEWVPIKKGTVSGSEIEVFGALRAGDQILLRGTDEIRPGTKVDPILPQEKS
ncbi:MAG: efflux RND transporter periplasmic adaptor subunit [Nitrospirae bacterium]|nr:efflux RND transporter periplasmic adaptor subunit [Nitrospirota bacterium]MDA1305322.1 efflux RND transporter periplasmic adaptor subunit [Nitrospirota bacterium]